MDDHEYASWAQSRIDQLEEELAEAYRNIELLEFEVAKYEADY